MVEKENLSTEYFDDKLLYFFSELVINKRKTNKNKNELNYYNYLEDLSFMENSFLDTRKKRFHILKLFYSKKENANIVKIFEPKFVKEKRKTYRIVYNNKMYPLTGIINIEENKIEKIKLINLNVYIDFLSYLSAIRLSSSHQLLFNKKEENRFIILKAYEIFKIIYKINQETREIKLFDKKFVKNNENICFLKFKNKSFKLQEIFIIDEVKSALISKTDKLEILLIGLVHISDTSYMFNDCVSLLEFLIYKDEKK